MQLYNQCKLELSESCFICEIQTRPTQCFCNCFLFIRIHIDAIKYLHEILYLTEIKDEMCKVNLSIVLCSEPFLKTEFLNKFRYANF